MRALLRQVSGRRFRPVDWYDERARSKSTVPRAPRAGKIWGAAVLVVPRERNPLLLLAKLTVAGALLVAAVQVTFSAPGHTPKIKTRWYYVVRATQGGEPVAARLTAQIVDPIGGAHPLTFGTTRSEERRVGE